MTLSRRETVLQAFASHLGLINTQAAGSGTQITIARNVDDAIAAPPAVVMVDGGHEKNSATTGGEVMGLDTYLLRVAVYGYCSNATDAGLGGDLSDLDARIVKAILTDPTLGGVAQYTRETGMDDPDWDHEKGRRPNAATMAHFEIEFITKQGDPFSLPS